MKKKEEIPALTIKILMNLRSKTNIKADHITGILGFINRAFANINPQQEDLRRQDGYYEENQFGK